MTVIIRRALDEHDQSIFPQRMSTEELHTLRAQGAIAFACQYLNDPVNLKGNFLKTEWISGYRWTEEMEQSGGRVGLPSFSALYAGVDPATSDSDSADYATIAIGGVYSNQLWLLRLIRRHMSVFKLKELLVELSALYSFHRIFFESVAAQAFMADFVSDSTWLPIEKSPTTGPKSFRFAFMSGKFQAGRVLVPMTYERDDNPCAPEFQPFWDEWKDFREDAESGHDDTLDAVEKLVSGATATPEAAGTTSDALYAKQLEAYNDPERRTHVFERPDLPNPTSMRPRLGGLTRRGQELRGHLVNHGPSRRLIQGR